MTTETKFRIEFIRWGTIYSPEYANTIEGAVRRAQAKGWKEGEREHDLRPIAARIFERKPGTYGRRSVWEEVAKVDKTGISRIEEPDLRPSVKEARQAIAREEEIISNARTTHARLVFLADEQFKKSQKKA